MLAKIVKGVEKIEDCLKDIMVNISIMNIKVESNATIIKKLGQ